MSAARKYEPEVTHADLQSALQALNAELTAREQLVLCIALRAMHCHYALLSRSEPKAAVHWDSMVRMLEQLRRGNG